MSLYSMLNAARSQAGPAKASRNVATAVATHQMTAFHQRVADELRQKLMDGDLVSSQRFCPRSGCPFLLVEIDDVELDYCPECHGVWFDSLELQHFTGFFSDVPGERLADRASSLVCPVCGWNLRAKQLHADTNLVVHACPRRHGVFLKDGEFERAIRAAERIAGIDGRLSHEHLQVLRALQIALVDGRYLPSSMRCLDCGRKAVLLTVNGVDIDFCVHCQSIWFDATELMQFTGLLEDIPGVELTSREAKHHCPKCREQLRLYQFRAGKNVFVEACPENHGVYLDAHRLALVLKASE